MSAEKILSEWKKKHFKPIYWLEGEEEFFIDEVMDYAEHHILSEADASFNKTVYYGKDANWVDVINSCKRYPMFSEKQVVLLKEAQVMSDIEKLEPYISNPAPSTIFVVSYKGKTLDKRSRVAKILKDKAEILVSQKLYDNKLPGWALSYIESKGFSISSNALTILIDHIGNDLSRIANEIEKLSLNMGGSRNITEDTIEQFVGISKEYNLNELQKAICVKNISKAVMIVQYFESNPKAVPIQLLLPSLYNFFSKVLISFQMNDRSINGVKSLFFNNPIASQDAMSAAKNYGFSGVENILLLLHEYNLKSIGIHSANDSRGSLIKELVIKIINHSS
ncbi:MAG: DNA polymerase III subunit delta [Ginsengibacter sp.]